MTDTTHLALPFIEGSQAQKHVTHNEALRILDTLVMLAVLDRDLSAPPTTPAEGARYLVKPTGSGAFAGKDNQIATFIDGEWWFFPPRAGWSCYVQDEGVLLAWNGSAWNSALDVLGGVSELQNLAKLGIATTADTTNPLSAKLNNALWIARTVAEGGSGDLRYKMSKESAAKTLSLLLQTNYSGRAEIGLTGDDDFHFKVSPDGSAWTDALLIDRTTGAAKLNSAWFLTGDISPAQITADQNDYNPTGLASASVLRLSSNANRNVTGLSGGGDGRIVTIVNAGTNAIVLKDANTSSSATNRFSFGTDVTLTGKQSAVLWYDLTDTRWKLLAGPVAASSGGAPADLELTLAEMALQVADNSSAALFLGAAGNRFADSFKALTYVDAAGATNLDSSSTGLLKPSFSISTSYANAGGTGNRAGSITVTASSTIASALAGFGGALSNLVNGGFANNTTDSTSASSSPAIAGEYFRFDFGTAKVITEAKWYQSDSTALGTWKWQGSSDASTWTDIGASFTLGGAATQTQTGLSGNASAFRYYRLLGVSGNFSNVNYQQEIEFKIGVPGSTNNVTVTSVSLTAAAVPVTMKMVARAKFIDSITLGTDLMFEVSRDGGTTFTAATMTDRFTSPSPTASIHVLESAAADVSGQPSGSSVKWRVRSANNKNFELHDISLTWS